MTTIQLDNAGTASGPPAANLTAPGSSIVVGIVNVDDYQQRDFDTGDLLFWDDGKPKMGKVVTGLVVRAEGVTNGTDDDANETQPGDLVSFWCERGKWFTYRDAVKAAGGINVGDVMKWTREADEPPTRKGAYPRKVYAAVIRRPEAKDGDLADRCVAEYHRLRDRPSLDEQAPAAHDDEEPF